MRLYAAAARLRLRQLGADAGLLVWLVVWVLVARAVHRRGARAGRARAGGRSAWAARSPGTWAPPPAPPATCPGSAARWPGRSSSLGSRRPVGRRQRAAVQSAVGTLAARARRRPGGPAGGLALVRWLPWRFALGAGGDGGPPAAGRRARPGAAGRARPGHRTAAPARPRCRPARPPRGGPGDPAAVRALAELELRRLGLRAHGTR